MLDLNVNTSLPQACQAATLTSFEKRKSLLPNFPHLYFYFKLSKRLRDTLQSEFTTGF